jgi:hypothetical protein
MAVYFLKFLHLKKCPKNSLLAKSSSVKPNKKATSFEAAINSGFFG